MSGDSPTTGRRRVVLVTAAAVALLVVAGLTVFLLTRPADEAPEDTAQDPPVPTISEPPESTPVSVPAPPTGGVATGGGATAVPGPPPPTDEQVASAREVIDQAIAAINSQDVAAMAALACDPAAVGQPEDVQPGVTAELAENPKIEGDKATAQVKLTIEGAPEPTVVPLPLQKRDDGSWCVP